MHHWVFSILVLATLGLEAVLGFHFTDLNIDNHPCKPENLKRTNRYVCDNHGNVICQSGWQEPEVRDVQNDLNPCLEPICEHGCEHGECRAPNYCSCDIGWEGPACDRCIPLPGCINGRCFDTAFQCNCTDGWDGGFCDIPKCNNCTNGFCASPNECICHDGWYGEDCNECQTRPGCLHGTCDGPHQCNCNPGWTGTMCDVPKCDPPCKHGFCHEAIGNNTTNFCICQSGWNGPGCDKCTPYWKCPNKDLTTSCTVPNECLCFNNEDDPNKLCNNTLLTHSLRN